MICLFVMSLSNVGRIPPFPLTFMILTFFNSKIKYLLKTHEILQIYQLSENKQIFPLN